jgi:hypothetical protein
MLTYIAAPWILWDMDLTLRNMKIRDLGWYWDNLRRNSVFWMLCTGLLLDWSKIFAMIHYTFHTKHLIRY